MSHPASELRPVVIAAGGTGGHMVPADVLADELGRRGHPILLLSDPRGLAFAGLFDRAERLTIPCASPGRGGPLSWPGSALQLFAGRRAALRIYRERRPSAVVGFGGYPALPALLAASAARLPTVIHEQNAVLGRTNRLLAPRVDRIATSYRDVERLTAAAAGAVLVGNPVRAEIAAIGRVPYQPPAAGAPVRVLVIGGSQGARVLSDVVPAALARLHGEGLALKVVQQCRPEDLDAAREVYTRAGVDAELAPFFTDMPARLAAAHLVVSRAGASSLAELTASGRPSILVPYAAAADDHQAANARELAGAGGADVILQAAFDDDSLAEAVRAAVLTEGRLPAMAAAALSLSRADAGVRLADLVEEVARAAGTIRTGAAA